LTTKENSSYSWKEKEVLLNILSMFLLYIVQYKEHILWKNE